MLVLTDFHHAGLLHSLIMLFEDRLGGKVYRPIGMEWADNGYWKVFDHPATQMQYLTLSQGFRPEDGSEPLNAIIDRPEPGIYYCQDIDSGYFNRAIDFETFKKTKFDIIIASLPQHIEPFKKLIETYQPDAKLIFQVGNQWDGIHADNIMASAKLSDVPEGINWIEYHQEFDLSLFTPFRLFDNSITSFMNIPDQFPDYSLLLEVEKLMPEVKVNIHGAQGRDGPLHGAKQVAQYMRNSQFVWHVKSGGDGYGHILFNSAACGVPCIVKKSYYNGKLGEKLLIDGKTCIDIDGLGVADIVKKIEYYMQADRYHIMCQQVYENFIAHVNFGREESNLREFIKRLQ